MQRPSVTQFQGLRFRSFFPGLSAARFFGGTDGVQLCLVSVAFLIVLYGWLLRKSHAWIAGAARCVLETTRNGRT